MTHVNTLVGSKICQFHQKSRVWEYISHPLVTVHTVRLHCINEKGGQIWREMKKKKVKLLFFCFGTLFLFSKQKRHSHIPLTERSSPQGRMGWRRGHFLLETSHACSLWPTCLKSQTHENGAGGSAPGASKVRLGWVATHQRTETLPTKEKKTPHTAPLTRETVTHTAGGRQREGQRFCSAMTKAQWPWPGCF